MTLFRFVLGIVILTTGRRLYWLVLGGVGFVFGFDLAERLVHGQPQSVIIVIALIAGVVGAMLAVFLQKFAVMAGGFFGGGYLTITLLKELGTTTSHHHWFIFLIGGILGALLMRVLFGWTLIVLSSAMGSLLILQTLHFAPDVRKLLFVFLMALGIAVQYGLFNRKPPPRRIRG
jgi:hypothetical protein